MSRQVTSISRFRRHRGLPVLTLALAGALAGCGGIFDVENPNSVKQDDIEKPDAVTALTNGTLSSTARAYARLMTPSATATDELEWIGSRQDWLTLDQGFVNNPGNEFLDAAYPLVSQARWLADEAIRSGEGFDAKKELKNRKDLARAYLYGAIVYNLIGDLFDDFVLSDRSAAAPPVGPDKMDQMYNTAIAYLDKALPIARAVGDGELETRILARRARAKFARAVWRKLNPPGRVPADPLVNDAEANADAQAVLARVGITTDWKWRFSYSTSTVTSDVGFQINQRQELRFDSKFATFPGARLSRPVAVIYKDPITGATDPALSDFIFSFAAGSDIGPLTVISAREMHLILAEAELARANIAGAITHINHVRGMNNLTPYDPARHAVGVLSMLKHERLVSLFLQGRRLADLYRFGERDPRWEPISDAVKQPGTFFPITLIERQSNPLVK
ncbi:MAG: hypothetical protein HY704_02545 [Gemmatimonadetes bacterium]|nr:hypothetical protein [Gemmatimonadota bacterium]